MKCLVLIISDDSVPVHEQHRSVWRTYMHSFPEIDAYFITHRPGIETTRIERDTIFVPGEERLNTILHKTIESMRFCLERNPYDYVLRTNLSSIWLFQRLLTRLQPLPAKDVYAGVLGWHDPVPFVSGAGILMSRDVALCLCKEADLAYTFDYIDDVAIGATFQRLGIPISSAFPRVDILYTPTSPPVIPSDIWHIRIKLLDDRANEPSIMRTILGSQVSHTVKCTTKQSDLPSS